MAHDTQSGPEPPSWGNPGRSVDKFDHTFDAMRRAKTWDRTFFKRRLWRTRFRLGFPEHGCLQSAQLPGLENNHHLWNAAALAKYAAE